MADYSDIINRAAKRYNVDPALIRGIIATESTNNPSAVSPLGATGLMQIMPSNYKALGITDARDPEQNIMGGTQLISQLLDRFKDPQIALRHYHGGDDTSKWGPVNAAYPGKVFAKGGITSQGQSMAQTLPGIPTQQSSGNALTDDAVFAAFSKGGTPSSAPVSGPTDDEIFSAFSPKDVAAPKKAPTMQPVASKDSPGVMESIGAGLGKGFGSTVLGAQQLIGKGLEALGSDRVGPWLTNDANQGLRNLSAQVTPYAAANPKATFGGELGGSVVATLPLAGIGKAATTLGSAARQGALAGGLGSLVSPTDPDSQSFWLDKLKQGAMGAAAGGVMSPLVYGLGRAISPNVSSDVRTLMDKGVQPTPGQILGGGFARTEDKLTSLPVLGDMIKNAQQRSVGQFNEAAYNQALAPIGQKFSGKVGQEGIEQVGKQIGAVYDDVLPKMQMRVDPQFQSDVVNLGQMAQSLPDAQQKTFMRVLKTQIFDKLGPQANMDGQTLKGVQSELARTAKGYLGDPSFDNRQLGSAVNALRDAVDSNLARVNPPELSDQLAKANQAWANFVRIRAAGASQGAMNNEGVFTAAQLQNAVRAADKSAGKGASATGSALMQDLSGAGQRVLGSKYPDSGTVGRGLLSLLAPGSVAAGLATAPGSTLATLGGIGLGTIPYTQTGQRLAAALLTARPQFAQPVGEAIRKLGPMIVPGSTAALLSGNR